MTKEKSCPVVCVIILNHNGWQDTLECVASVKNIAYPNCRLVVVDNGSTDESVDQLAQFCTCESVVLLETGENLGIAGGNNHGVKYALENGADFVTLLSNDTTVDPDFLEHMVEVALSDDGVGLVGAKILYYDEPTRIWFAGAKMNPWLARAPHIGANQPDAAFSGVWDVDLLMGCVMLIKKEVCEHVGLFDDRYFFQNEDLEFSYRVRRGGWKIKVNMDARIYHKIGHTIGAESYDRWYYATRNRLLFIEENLPPMQRLTAKTFFVLSRPLKFIKWIARARPDLIRATLEGWSDYRNRQLGCRLSTRG